MSSIKYFLFIYGCLLLAACEREHLQPTIPGQPDPLVYFIGRIGTDSIRVGGGIDDYVGNTYVTDTLTNRVFHFTLEQPLHPQANAIRISINNYMVHPGTLQDDLDNSIFPDDRHYQDNHPFIPLAVTVEWHNNHGIRYSSKALIQSDLFSITEVTEIIHEGKPYKKVTAEFECNLSDGAGHLLHLTHGRAVMLFGGF